MRKRKLRKIRLPNGDTAIGPFSEADLPALADALAEAVGDRLDDDIANAIGKGPPTGKELTEWKRTMKGGAL